jgi:anti-sigma regulatory factor (Ser/Thr protein kinase)
MTYQETNLLFLGMVGAMLLFNSTMAYLQRERVSLYYSGYMVCWLVYFGGRYPALLSRTPEPVFHFVRVAVPMLAYVFNFEFATELMGLRQKVPRVHRAMRLVQGLLTAYIAVEVLLCFLTDGWQRPIHEILHTIVRLGLAGFSGYVIVQCYRLRERLVSYFITGSVFFIAGGLLSMALTILMVQTDLFPDNSDHFLYSPITFLQLGVVLELLCFSLGLSYRNKLVELEKSRAEQLLENERQQRERDRLQALLDAQRASRQVTDLRVRALRAQMNPHFLFNSLNAIQECILTNQTDAAASYLAKFSKLVRLILESSDKPTIPLTKEIDTLRLYLDVEALRFTQAFRYEIRAETHLDASLLSIPPMLVQPYAENAIWHGLLHKEGDRKLLIEFTSDDDFLYVRIEDNGVGREQATGRTNPLKKEYTSRGMKLTDERLEALGELLGERARAGVEDLVAPDGQPAGTRVTLTLPLQ